MRNIYEKLFLNLAQWFRSRCHLKYFLSRALAVILVEGIMGNVSVKLI